MCPALKEARIRAHHNLADMLWQRLERLQSKWQVVRELTVSGLLGLSAPVDRRDEWCRVWDMLTEEDLDVTGDPVFLQACCASVRTLWRCTGQVEYYSFSNSPGQATGERTGTLS